jgi:prophage tail gpP-like protein
MASPSETASLSINGQLFSAWTSMSVTRVYGSSIGSEFEFECAEPLDTSTDSIDFTTWKIIPGDRCTVTLAGILACTGYVFVRHPSFTAEAHGLKITGRSLTADAVDSSAPIKGGQYDGYTFQALASALAQSAGVNFIVKGSSPNLALPFPRFQIQYGETVFSAIERLARLRGMHLTDDANGNLVASAFNPSAATAGQLVEGQNLIQAHAVIDGSNAFGAVTAAAQRPGNEQVNGDACRDNSATLINPNARAARQRLFIMEEPGSAQDCAIRVNHEMAYAAADLVDCHCVVQGWQSAPGVLWDIAQNYSVNSPMLDLQRVLASCQVKYIQDAKGTRTEINLCTPQSLAFASGAVITPTAQPGEPAYNATPSQVAAPNPPDN